MAIALVNTATGTNATDPATFSFTCDATSNLLVILYLWRTTGTAAPAGITATYGAQNMTTLFNSQIGGMGVGIWWLYNPTTGSAQTFSTDMTAAATAGRMVGAAFSGADTAHTPSLAADTAGAESTTTATPSVSISPTSADGVTVTGCAHESANIMTAKGANQTGLGGDADGFIDEGVWNTAFTYELNPTVGADADTQTFTNGTSDVSTHRCAWFAAATVAATSLIYQPYNVLTSR